MKIKEENYKERMKNFILKCYFYLIKILLIKNNILLNELLVHYFLLLF